MFVYPGATSGSPLIPRQGNNKVSTTLTTCCQNGNILYIENTQRCDILPLCFTPIMKIFLILIQDQGLSSIFVIVNFLAVIALREDVVLSSFHSLYFLWESWQKTVIRSRTNTGSTSPESWETICLLLIILEHWLTKWSLILATAGTRLIEQ